jgi:hypothetical protein
VTTLNSIVTPATAAPPALVAVAVTVWVLPVRQQRGRGARPTVLNSVGSGEIRATFERISSASAAVATSRVPQQEKSRVGQPPPAGCRRSALIGERQSTYRRTSRCGDITRPGRTVHRSAGS